MGWKNFAWKEKKQSLETFFFTPGARILRNETFTGYIVRLTPTEIVLIIEDPSQFELMGIWDHFYSNSALDQNTSTHYVNLPHFAEFKSKPQVVLDDQHDEFKWFDLSVVSNDEKFHPYIRNYTGWVLKKMDNSYD